MSDHSTFVIVGGGLAGAKLAEALRDKDFTGHIVLFAEEDSLPYERPPLSKEHVAGEKSLSEFTVQPSQWYRDHNVDLRLGTAVTSIDPKAKTVTLPDDTTVAYDKLALATGSTSRSPDVPGVDADGVYYLRTIGESDAIVDALESGGRLAIVGAGWIGLEIAAAAREKDVAVTVVESAELPLLGPLGPEMGAVFRDLHREHDVDFRFDATVEEITTQNGRATGLRLGDGSTVAADAVLLAVGAQPNIGLAEDAGLDVDSGVLVDAGLTTSDPNIVAVGDIAEQQHPTLGRRIRVEHWANAQNQPEVAAATMLGKSAEYDKLPYFFSDQYDLGMEYVGAVPSDGYADVVVRGDRGKREFVAFWLDADKHVLAGMNVNVWDVTDTVKSLIASGRAVDPARLADPDTDLNDVYAHPTGTD